MVQWNGVWVSVVLGCLFGVVTGCSAVLSSGAEQGPGGGMDLGSDEVQQVVQEFPEGGYDLLDRVRCDHRHLEDVAERLEETGGDEYVVEMYEWCIDEYPLHPQMPRWVEAVTERLEEGDFDVWERSVVEYLEVFHPDESWRIRNQHDESAVEAAEEWARKNLEQLGVHYHSEAQDRDAEELYAQAVEYYHEFIEWFPDHHVSFDMRWFLGEIYLYQLEEFEEAAHHFQYIVDLYLDDEIPDGVDEEDRDGLVRDAAYSVVYAYDVLVRERYPDSILVEMVERADEHRPTRRNSPLANETIFELARQHRSKTVEAPGEDEHPGVSERRKLREWEEKLVDASDQFSEQYPNDNITPTFDFVAAEVLRDHGRYDEAVARLRGSVESAPEHLIAQYARAALMEVYYRQRDWDELERWARRLMDHHHTNQLVSEELLAWIIDHAVEQQGE